MPRERSADSVNGDFTSCGDCGTPLSQGAIGCNRCGRNLAAERAAGKVLVWIAAVVMLAIVAIIWLVRA